VTSETAALSALVRELEALRIPYMVSGSFASSFHGKPRTTHDADVVIDPSPEALEALVSALAAAGFYVAPDVARDALQRRRQFNVIAPETAFKLDLIIRKERPFSREELKRRQAGTLAGAPAMFASAEDTILSKLEWAKKGGGSERQLEDVRGVVDVKGADLDRGYIERWAGELDVLDLWRRVTSGET
jgi:hypothetical protein